MISRSRFVLAGVALLLAGKLGAAEKNSAMKFGMVIHGGAGTIERSEMTAENEEAHRAGLEHALQTGYDILKKGGSSLDAVEAAIRIARRQPAVQRRQRRRLHP